jgi:tripartite-type tricarboxylate transporter receptor subunit TctC
MATAVPAMAMIAAISIAPAGAEDFYRDKTIRLVVGSDTGGGYDTYARLVARYMGNHIPGKPALFVANMPGASSIKATNYLYSVAAKDGLTIGSFNKSIPVYQAIKHPGVNFDSRQFSWIGSLSQAVDVGVVWHTTPVKTIADAQKAEVILGSTGSAGTMSFYPSLLNSTVGTRFKIVSGYKSFNEVMLAMERGEVLGCGSAPWTTWKTTKSEWIKEGKIVPLVQVGLKKAEDLPDVPRLIDLAQNDEQRRIFEFVSTQISMERPYAAPPGIPSERLAILRGGLQSMAKDKEFIAAALSQGVDVDPQSGEDVAKIVAAILDTPAPIVEKVVAIMAAADKH